MKFIVVAVLALFLSCSSRDFNLEILCIDGHIYYYNSNHGYKAGGIAPKFNDDGTPCKCQNRESVIKQKVLLDEL